MSACDAGPMGDMVVEHIPPRFEIVDDGQVVGFAEYEELDGVRAFTHVEVARSHRGRGVAGDLVRAAFDATRADGLAIAPLCPYALAFSQRHHDWDDILHR